MSIIIQQVHKRYKLTHALKDVSININTGLFGLLGPNGAGKTTLMRLIMGLHQQNQGDITVFDIKTTDRKNLREIVSYLPQEYAFYPSMTVYEAMDYMAILCGMKDKTVRRLRIKTLLEAVNLMTETKKKVKALSGGMKRRLGLAQALIKDPKVLIVDEPTAGLDPEERLRIRNLLAKLSKERIIIFSTHIVEDIAFSCDQLAVISKGQIVFEGQKEALIQQANDMVYETDIKYEELELLQSKYNITSIEPSKSHVKVRILHPNLHFGDCIQPTLEDAYLYLMSKENS